MILFLSIIPILCTFLLIYELDSPKGSPIRGLVGVTLVHGFIDASQIISLKEVFEPGMNVFALLVIGIILLNIALSYLTYLIYQKIQLGKVQ